MTIALKTSFIVIACSIVYHSSLLAVSSLANNDPYPMYSTVYDPYLTTWEKECLMGHYTDYRCKEFFGLSISPFIQKAHSGKDYNGDKTDLGNLQGTWNMLGMEYGDLPSGVSLVGTQLGEAKLHIFSDFPGITPNTLISTTSNDAYLLLDPDEFIGFFSVPIHYTKMGIRFDFAIQPFCNDFGFTLQGGISEIKQTFSTFVDLTPFGDDTLYSFSKSIPVLDNNNNPLPCTTTVAADPVNCTTPLAQIEAQLMDFQNAELIFTELGLNPCNFEGTSFEDLRFMFWWRSPYPVNTTRAPREWPHLLMVPSICGTITAPTARAKDRKDLFSLPFGNDGHASLSLDLGLAFDFNETIEVAFDVGVTYFVPRTIKDFRVPTSVYQQGVFPYATTVRRSPGNNYNFDVAFHAYRFLDKLSAYVDFIFVKHENDHISIKNGDPAFLPKEIECISKFSAQFVNGALNYEISPNVIVGIMGQFPISQRNAYRSTTWMATVRAVF